MKIFKNQCKIFKKYYIEKINSAPYETIIKKVIFSLTNIDISIKLVGKYNCDISVFEENQEVIFFYIFNNSTNIFYKNYLLFEKDEHKKRKERKNKKAFNKEVLVFKIENSIILEDKFFTKLDKKEFKIADENKELNIEYLISEQTDEIFNFYEEAEKIYKESIKENSDSESIIEPYKRTKIKSSNKKEKIEPEKENDFFGNYSDLKLEKNFGESNSFSEQKVDYNSNEFMLFPIDEEFYKDLLDGNADAEKDIIKQIDKDIKKKSFLGKKRKYK